MSHRIPTHRVIVATAVLAGSMLASAGAGMAVFSAHAQTIDANVNAGVAVNGSAEDKNKPLMDAAQGAEDVAKSAGLHAAITVAWQTAWQKSWPFIRDMFVKFFGLFGQLWHTITGNIRANQQVNANAAVNADMNANAAVNQP